MATSTKSRPAAKKKTKSAAAKLKSRAVLRPVDAGNSAYCAHCGDLIKFRAKIKARQVICNVYLKSTWDRVEHFHEECYDKANAPYGEPPVE